MMEKPEPCCTASRPSTERRDFQHQPGVISRPSLRSDLIGIETTTFHMGCNRRLGVPTDGEGPQREVCCKAFSIAACTVSNVDFDHFIQDTGYTTDAQKFGWSFVFDPFVARDLKIRNINVALDQPWWRAVAGACWAKPEGPGSHVKDRMDHPVTHVSWFDAKSYCQWSGTRLPTEAEWELSARGGLDDMIYPWGNELLPQGQHRCNIWQGEFPTLNLGSDGYEGTAPVNAYEPNGYNLYNHVGNVWEWCEDWFSPNYHRVTKSENPYYMIPGKQRVMRGGSFLCHHSYCNRYRVAARNSNTPHSTTSNCGFRVAGDCIK